MNCRIRRSEAVKRGGFTLIEISLVLLILAIVAAAAVLNPHLHRRAATWSDVTSSLDAFDHQTRLLCQRRSRPCLLKVDLGEGSIRRNEADKDNTERSWGSDWKLPGGYAIAEAYVGQEHVTSGQAGFFCSPGGNCPSYAFRLVDSGGKGQWVLMPALSGSLVEVDSEKQVRDLLDNGSDKSETAALFRPDAR